MYTCTENSHKTQHFRLIIMLFVSLVGCEDDERVDDVYDETSQKG